MNRVRETGLGSKNERVRPGQDSQSPFARPDSYAGARIGKVEFPVQLPKSTVNNYYSRQMTYLLNMLTVYMYALLTRAQFPIFGSKGE